LWDYIIKEKEKKNPKKGKKGKGEKGKKNIHSKIRNAVKNIKK